MSEILQDTDGAVCLMDDILVHEKSQEQHDRRLVTVLRRLQEAGLTLNEKKCVFSESSEHLLDSKSRRGLVLSAKCGENLLS